MVRIFSRRIFDGAIFTLHPKAVRLGRRVAILHAHKGGGTVLRGDASWRTVSGVQVRLRHSTLLIQFRGRPA